MLSMNSRISSHLASDADGDAEGHADGGQRPGAAPGGLREYLLSGGELMSQVHTHARARTYEVALARALTLQHPAHTYARVHARTSVPLARTPTRACILLAQARIFTE